MRGFIQEKSRTNQEVFKFTLVKGFLPKYAEEVLHAMEKDGTIVVCDLSADRPRNKGALYLTWDAYKNPPRLKFATRSPK